MFQKTLHHNFKYMEVAFCVYWDGKKVHIFLLLNFVQIKLILEENVLFSIRINLHYIKWRLEFWLAKFFEKFNSLTLI